ncbi:MAG: hypothetical protein AAF546_10210 [Verrucomicrobiota bacterium]
MKHTLLFIMVAQIALLGCTQMNAPTQSGLGWYRNDQGLITSGIQPVGRETKVITEGNKTTWSWEAPQKELRDPLEDYPEFSLAFKDANKIADKKAEEYGRQLGQIHVFWSEKKRVLRQNYQIDWKTPAELNTHICYD